MIEPKGEAALDELSRALRGELERRDDMILALEMLVVDQASRLLALESLVLEALAGDDVDLLAVQARVADAAERFRASFEAIEGFAERAQRIVGEMVDAAAKDSTKRSARPSGKAKAGAKASAKVKPKAKPKAKVRQKPARR